MAIRRTASRRTNIEEAELIPGSKALSSYTPQSFNNLSARNKNFIIFLSVAIIVLIGIFFFKRAWLVAASVNGSPVSNLDVQTQLNQEYRDTVIDQLVNEKIVEIEAQKKGVSVTPQEVDQKISEYETQYGGSDKFDQILKQQNMTRNSLRSYIKNDLYFEKMYGGEVSVSAKEVDDYITVNKSVLQATEEGAQKTEAEKNIRAQKTFQISSQKFQELKDAAKVTIF